MATLVADSGLVIVDRLNLSHKIACERDSTIYVPLEAPPSRALYRGAGAQNCPLVWSADGRHLYFGDRGLIDIDPATRRVCRVDLPPGVLPVDALSCSANGAELAFLGTNGRRVQIYHLSRTKGVLRSLTADRAGGGKIFSADLNWRTRIALVRLIGDQVVQLDLGADSVVRSFTLPPAADTPRLGPRGGSAAFGAHGGLFTLDLATGGMAALTPFGSLPAWSPDGRSIAYTSWPGELWRVSVEERLAQRLLYFADAPRVRRGGVSFESAPIWSPDGRYLWLTLAIAERCGAPASEIIRQIVDGDWSIVPPAERGQAIAESVEELYWRHCCVSGIIDFLDGTVCLVPGFLPRAAWSPAERATPATFFGSSDPTRVDVSELWDSGDP